MFAYAFLALLTAATAGILGSTLLAGVAGAVAQLVLIAALIAFMVLILMGEREQAPAAYRSISSPSDLRPSDLHPSDQHADRRTESD